MVPVGQASECRWLPMHKRTDWLTLKGHSAKLLIAASVKATGIWAVSSFLVTSGSHMQFPTTIQREQELKDNVLTHVEEFKACWEPSQPNVQALCAAVIFAVFYIFETWASYCWHTKKLAKYHAMIQHIKKQDSIMNHCAKGLHNMDRNSPYKSTVVLEWKWLLHGRHPFAKKNVV